jgi:hypothetical protein
LNAPVPTLFPVTPTFFVPEATFSIIHETTDTYLPSRKQPKNISSVLDPSRMEIYRNYCRVYGDHLYSLEMFEQRAELYDMISMNESKHDGLCNSFNSAIGICCSDCGEDLRDINGSLKCHDCKRIKRGPMCCLCRIPVHGLSWFCLDCLHGGHAGHMKEWFSNSDECPTGCGCECMSG